MSYKAFRENKSLAKISEFTAHMHYSHIQTTMMTDIEELKGYNSVPAFIYALTLCKRTFPVDI